MPALSLTRIWHSFRSTSENSFGRKHDWEFSVHAPSQKGIGISSQRGQNVKSFLRRDRTHFARSLAGRRGSRRACIIKSLEVDPARTRNEILKELDPNFTPPESEAELPQEGDKKDVKTPALRAFGRDLTELAKKGELDPVIGRKNEIERVIQILCRRTKNNPVLLGEAGVGKTVDLALMVAGTKYRGQLEERMQVPWPSSCLATPTP